MMVSAAGGDGPGDGTPAAAAQPPPAHDDLVASAVDELTGLPVKRDLPSFKRRAPPPKSVEDPVPSKLTSNGAAAAENADAGAAAKGSSANDDFDDYDDFALSAAKRKKKHKRSSSSAHHDEVDELASDADGSGDDANGSAKKKKKKKKKSKHHDGQHEDAASPSSSKRHREDGDGAGSAKKKKQKKKKGGHEDPDEPDELLNNEDDLSIAPQLAMEPARKKARKSMGEGTPRNATSAGATKGKKKIAAGSDDDSDAGGTGKKRKRQSGVGASGSVSKTTGQSRLAKPGVGVGTPVRKSIYLDKDHVVERGLVDWFKPHLHHIIELWVKQHCAKANIEFDDTMVREFAYHSLSRQREPLKFILKDESRGREMDDLLNRLAYITLAKCLPFTSTYCMFYADDDPQKPTDETAGVNCEAGWKPMHRPIRSFVLDVFPFAAKGTGEPTMSMMCNALDYFAMEDASDRAAWEICCQLQVCNVAFVTTLGLQMLFTDDYTPEKRVKAIIHAIRSNRLIRDKDKLRNVKHMHVVRRLILDRIVSADWLNNPHVPASIRKRLSDPTAICRDSGSSKKPAPKVGDKDYADSAAIQAAVADLGKSHRELYETAQKSFSSFDWKPRTKGDTYYKDLGDNDSISAKKKRTRKSVGGKGGFFHSDEEEEELGLYDDDEDDAFDESLLAPDDEKGYDENGEALPAWVLKTMGRASGKNRKSASGSKGTLTGDEILAEWEREDQDVEGDERRSAALDAVPLETAAAAAGAGAALTEAEVASTTKAVEEFVDM